MPRKTLRKRIIEELQSVVNRRRKYRMMRLKFDDDNSLEDMIDLHYLKKLKHVSSRRYLDGSRLTYRKRTNFDWDDCLNENSQNYNDNEFLYTFRMNRESFKIIVNLIKDNQVFHKVGKKKQRPVEHQLLVFLFRIGKRGSAGSHKYVAQHFGIGVGTVKSYVDQVVKALVSLKDDFVYWPDENERDEMKARLSLQGWPDCVGIIDGTHVGLETKPLKYHECYFNRKSFYSINVTIVCDDRGKIIYFYAGWPGTTHDNRVFRNSDLYKNYKNYFRKNEHLLGDSAYSNSRIMVQSFKKTKGTTNLTYEKEFFNTKLASVRIKSEHCIGILKSRFPCLKTINVCICHGNPEVKFIVDLVGACSVLHNILLECNDQIPQTWYDKIAKEISWNINGSNHSSDNEIDDDSYEYDDDIEMDMREEHYKRIISNYI